MPKSKAAGGGARTTQSFELFRSQSPEGRCANDQGPATNDAPTWYSRLATRYYQLDTLSPVRK